MASGNSPSNDMVVDLTNESEDEDLKRAIALSLQDFDNAERHEKQLSNAYQNESYRLGNSREKEAVGDGEAPSSISGSSSSVNTGIQIETRTQNRGSMLGLDRKAMEEERLVRLKRKRGNNDNDYKNDGGNYMRQLVERTISPPPFRRQDGRRNGSVANANGIVPLETTISNGIATHGGKPGIERNDRSNKSSTPHAMRNGAKIPPSTPQSELQYPKGIVLQTPSSSPTVNDPLSTASSFQTRSISFSSLVDAENLQSCLLSSFIWDFDWLFPHFHTKTTKFVLVMQAKHPLQRQQICSDFEGIPNIRICFPSMQGIIHCMHSKLMLLFYKTRCRIVIPTANLMSFDWGVSNVMENTIWLIDLPSLPNLFEMQQQNETQFQRDLIEFLKAQKVPEDVVEKLNQFDFSETSNLGFIHSIGGVHTRETWRMTGLCGLSKTISEMSLATNDPIQIDYVSSSIGSLNDEFMQSMYIAAQGHYDKWKPTQSTLHTTKKMSGKVRREILKTSNNAQVVAVASDSNQMTKGEDHDWKANFRVYYPSNTTVQASNGGPACAGTICFSRDWWEGSKFPRQTMRDCISVREGMLMHNKIIFVQYMQPRPERLAVCRGWAYIGSANLSESAWGRLVHDRSSKVPKLNNRNWECGVLIPVTVSTKSIGSQQINGAIDLRNNFAETVPVPMKCPASDYAEGQRQPWFRGKDD